MVKKNEFVTAARRWLGTPYEHQASVRGQGADCLGLLRGVWREVLGEEPVAVPFYTADWSEVSKDEVLWSGARGLLSEVHVDAPGDILLFRMQRGSVAKHLGIRANSALGFPTIIHSYSRRGVVETPLTEPWQRKVVALFEFPTES